MMEFNVLLEGGALSRNRSGVYVIDYVKMPVTLAKLAKELLEMEATGDRARVENWFTKYDKMPADLTATLASTKNIPVDVYPIYSFSDPPAIAETIWDCDAIS